MNDDNRFDHYPTLQELGFSNGGVPGITYAYLAAEDRRKAKDDGYGDLIGGNDSFFTVTGPKGEIDLEVRGKGRPIRGIDTNQFRPKIWVSDRAFQTTGLLRGDFDKPSDEPKETSVGKKQAQAT